MLTSELEFSHIVRLTSESVSIPSVSGQEREVLDYFSRELAAWDWSVEKLPVEGERYNIFSTFGTPRIVFTTHVDVVPASPALFKPVRDGDRIVGRGACDAKGIAATMAVTCERFRQKGYNDFGFLLVVGEEHDGIGARAAARSLGGRGIEYIVNGEPTERKLVIAHKGTLGFRVECKGRTGHSGYPENADDANAKLIRIANKLLDFDFGTDELLGKATANVGVVRGGIAPNVISDNAYLECLIRLVGPPELGIAQVEQILGEDGKLSEVYALPPARMERLPGFETSVVSYWTDVPNFSALGAKALLFGPGSIEEAHTEHEFIDTKEMMFALEDFERIFTALR